MVLQLAPEPVKKNQPARIHPYCIRVFPALSVCALLSEKRGDVTREEEEEEEEEKVELKFAIV